MTDRRAEIDSIFGHALPLIESVLFSQYALRGEEATQVEQSLYEWFQGFARRPGSPRSGEGLRPHLLLMTCHAAHVYWSGKVSDAPPSNDNVKRALALGPQQIAIELEHATLKTGSRSSKATENGPKNPEGQPG